MPGFLIFLTLTGAALGAAIDLAVRARVRAGRWTLTSGETSPAFSTMLTALAGAGMPLASAHFLAGDPGLILLSAIYGWLLLTLAAIDLRLFILPDGLNLALLLAGAVMVWLYRPDVWMWHAAGAATGYALLWLVETGYRRLRGRDGLGRGDAKLLGAIGMWTGLTGIAPVLLVASLGGIATVVVMGALRRTSISGQTMIAFGPWIALGGYCVWLVPLLSVG